MWTFGHFCLGYIISRPMFENKPLKPISLLSIFFMASVLDSIHVYSYRPIMHSLVFFFPFAIVLLLVIYKIDIIKRNEFLPLFVASLTHVLGDIFFGSFALLVPLSNKEVGIFAWGDYLNLTVEICLFVIMMIMLIYTGDLKKLEEVSILKLKEKRGQRIFQNFVLIMFILVTIGQIVTIIYLDFMRGHNFYNEVVYNDRSMLYISFLFMAAQIIFLYILIKWASQRFTRSKKSIPNAQFPKSE